MQSWWKYAFVLLCGLLGAGILMLTAGAPRGEPIRLMSPPTPVPLVVHVTGEVHKPGVYSFDPGSRVRDALEAAGGALVDADLDAVNLAAFLEDGQKLVIPAIRPVETPLSNSLEIPATSAAAEPGEVQRLVNINIASQAELESLPGIGPAIARRIITYRETEGAFSAKEDIQKVSGIGPATYERLKDLISVSD